MAQVLPFLDELCPLVFIRTRARQQPSISFVVFLRGQQRRLVTPTPLPPISPLCVDNPPEGSDVISVSCI